MDFGYTGNGDNKATSSDAPKTNADGSVITDLTTGNQSNGDNSISDDDDVNKPGSKGENNKPAGFDNGDNNKPDNIKPNANDNTNTDTELVAGSIIEVGDEKYTVDATGNIVDKDNNIFKEAKDAKDWMATFDTINDGDDKELSIATIQNTLGIEIIGEDEKPIVFENNAAGVKAYIEAVNEANRDDHYEQAINTFYQKYPIINDVLNYYVANGNSLEGFGEVQDRSGITIDDTNEAQHESIIRTAWTEQNRKGNVDNYIAYLKSNGTLLPIAKEELTGMQEGDQQTKEDMAVKAQAAEDVRIEKLESYWNSVQEVIKSKSIAGYEIPDTIIVSKDGKKSSATPNDFYNYVYQIDKDNKSAYERDLAKDDPINRRNDELLRAYLKFVGGNYSNLVGMAVNKDKVKVLKLQAANRTANSIKVTKPNTETAKGVNTDFGFN